VPAAGASEDSIPDAGASGVSVPDAGASGVSVPDAGVGGGLSCWPLGNGIIESLRLEKMSKIIKSNRQPNTTMPAKPCPEEPHLHVF